MNILICGDSFASELLSDDSDEAQDLFINTAPVFLFNNQYKRGGSLSVEILEEIYCSVNEESC